MLDVRASGGMVVVGARVRPRSRPGLRESDGGLVVSVAAPPEKGKANEEARRALAGALGVAPSAVTLRSGGKARRKVFEVTGVDATTARARLLAASGPG
ncbi:MAG: DUF167 domain-containing protein [Actinomycetota bacterium]